MHSEIGGQPQTSLLGAVRLLAAGAAGVLPERAHTLSVIAQRSGERLNKLIDDVLDVTKIEGDRMPLSLREQRAVPLLKEAIASQQVFAEQRDVTLLLCVPDGQQPQIEVDGDRLIQILGNLLNNAVKYSPPGGTVKVSMAVKADRIKVSVRDQGPGIPEAFRAQLFEKFTQADGSDRRQQGGTGLGLHISRLLAERMGGQLQAEMVTGRGACFSLTLPRGGLARQKLLVVGPDHRMLQRIKALCADIVDIRQVSALPTSADIDEVRALIASPAGQGDADRFCAALGRLARGRPLLLWGDALDKAYADRVGLPWMAGRDEEVAAFRRWLRDALKQPEAVQ